MYEMRREVYKAPSELYRSKHVFIFYALRLEVAVCVVEIDEIVDDHCLFQLFFI